MLSGRLGKAVTFAGKGGTGGTSSSIKSSPDRRGCTISPLRAAAFTIGSSPELEVDGRRKERGVDGLPGDISPDCGRERG